MSYVVCLRSDLMGSGDNDLGKVLMESFMESLNFQQNMPSHVVLYNAGVKLAMKQSPACRSLSELEEKGCRIILSGTCVDHFGIQYDIGVGTISNMLLITGILTTAEHLVCP